MVALGLYWGEGTKRELNIINGDIQLIKTFLTGLYLLGVNKNDISINIRYYSNQDKNVILDKWLKALNLPKSTFVGFEKVESSGENKLSDGMCRLRVKKSGDMHKLIMAGIQIISSGSSMDRTKAS